MARLQPRFSYYEPLQKLFFSTTGVLQVLLRHLVQLGMIVIPKSIKQHRIKENFDILDFELTKEEVEKMNKLDKGSKAR